MSELTDTEHALRVTVLEALKDAVTKEYERARAAAEPAFAVIRRKGKPQQEVLLPSGEKIGLISIKAGEKTCAPDEDALLAFTREYLPDEVEPFIDPAALKDPDIASYIKAFHPHFAIERVSGPARKVLLDQAAKAAGYVVAPDGEKAKVAEVTTHNPSGAFSLTGSGAQQRRNRIVAEWQAGRIPEAILGPLALRAGGYGDA